MSTESMIKDDWGLGIAVDSEAIKEQHEKEKDSGSGQKWRIAVGKKLTKLTARLLPNPHRSSHYYTLFYHFNIVQYGLLCINKTLNQNCPICQEFETLKKELIARQTTFQKEHPDVDIKAKFKPEWKTLFQLEAKPRYYMAVINRADAVPEIKYLDMSQTIKDIIIPKIIEKPIYLHPLQGRDWKFEYVPKSGSSDYGDVRVEKDDDSTPILPKGNIEEIRTLVQNIPDLMKLIEIPSYADLKIALESLTEDDEEPVSAVSLSSTLPAEDKPDSGKEKIKTEDILNDFFAKK